jgi:hypothetical protein
VKLFGLHFCDVGSRQLDVNNDVPREGGGGLVKKVFERDTIIARFTEFKRSIIKIENFI